MKHSFTIISIALVALLSAAMTPEARKSFEAFESRAENGDAEAQFRLSGILERGFDSIPADSVRSLSLLRRSAMSGYAPALNYLGFLFHSDYIVGTDTIQRANLDSLFHYIRLAADQGDPKAASNLAFLLLHPSQSPSQSSPSQSSPHSPSQPSSASSSSSRADSLKDTSGIAPFSCSGAERRALAISYLRKAASARLPQAMTMLADIYVEDSKKSDKKDPIDKKNSINKKDSIEAVSLYEQAIAEGFHDAELKLLNLIGPSLKDLDSRTSLSEAIRYWHLGAPTIAVELLHNIPADSPEAPRAYALLGHAYSRGLGVQYDHALANRYFAQAAILGDPAASFILAETLEIFPDALTSLLPATEATLLPPAESPHLPDPATLRANAAEAGITTAESAVAAILSPL